MTKTEAAESRRRMMASTMGINAVFKPIVEFNRWPYDHETVAFPLVKAAQWLNVCAYVEANGAEE